jgi:hypothetical protein
MPGVLLTNSESALKNTLTILLPDIPQLLCVWHINKNLQAHVQSTWHNNSKDTEEERKEKETRRQDFIAAWYQVVYSKTESQFEEKYATLKATFASQLVLCSYLNQYQYPQRHEVVFF